MPTASRVLCFEAFVTLAPGQHQALRTSPAAWVQEGMKSRVIQQSASAAPELMPPLSWVCSGETARSSRNMTWKCSFLPYLIQIHICSSTTCIRPAKRKPAGTCQAVTRRSSHCQDRLCSNTVSPKYLSVLCDLSGASETSVLDGVMQA